MGIRVSNTPNFVIDVRVDNNEKLDMSIVDKVYFTLSTTPQIIKEYPKDNNITLVDEGFLIHFTQEETRTLKGKGEVEYDVKVKFKDGTVCSTDVEEMEIIEQVHIDEV